MNGYRKKWRPSLQMVLLSVSLVVLLLPLGGIHILKLYESALIRQTESELISQAAFISAAYKNEIAKLLEANGQGRMDYGMPLPEWALDNDYYRPIPQMLDLAKDPILPVRPPGKFPGSPPAPMSVEAGEQLLPVLKEAQRITLSGMKVLDYQGIQVAGQQETGISFAHLPEVQEALTGESVSVIRRRSGQKENPPLSSISRGAGINVYVTAPIVLENRLIGAVLVNRTPTDIVKALYGKRSEITQAAVFVLLVTLGITLLTSYAITQPIRRLIRQARLVASGDQNGMQPIEHPTTREIAILSESLAAMARTIEHRSEYIRQFAMHVSHEFKTPLTAIQGSIELLQEHMDTMTDPQREKFLSNIAEDTDRLKRLVTRLLELARADVTAPASEPVDILPVLEPLSGTYRDTGLAVHVENTSNRQYLPVPMSREALEAVFGNLLDNSAQHGASRVDIQLQVKDSQVEARVADNGTGISAANRDKLFTPFFTTHRESGGTGLGLSIVQSLLNAGGGDIRLAEGPVTVFVIRLPLA